MWPNTQFTEEEEVRFSNGVVMQWDAAQARRYVFSSGYFAPGPNGTGYVEWFGTLYTITWTQS